MAAPTPRGARAACHQSRYTLRLHFIGRWFPIRELREAVCKERTGPSHDRRAPVSVDEGGDIEGGGSVICMGKIWNGDQAINLTD